jgi:superfamily II DNA/RNA helicase
MEQTDRERSLIKFRNGTHQILLATDLAARGIDVPEIKYIIHYHLPLRAEEFTHRNGRTARMNTEGTAYVLHYEKDPLPDFVGNLPVEKLAKSKLPGPSDWSTLFVSGGRKDKISKGDVAGLFFQAGKSRQRRSGRDRAEDGLCFCRSKNSDFGEAPSKSQQYETEGKESTGDGDLRSRDFFFFTQIRKKTEIESNQVFAKLFEKKSLYFKEYGSTSVFEVHGSHSRRFPPAELGAWVIRTEGQQTGNF